MVEVEERRRPNNLGKRKASGSPAEEESDLQRAVKKLIRQAQLEADSPSQSMEAKTTPTSGPSGWSPAKAQGMDMRIFSDTPRDRPVFDAYPMPPPQSNPPPQMLQIPNQSVSGTSPFTFPVDPTNTTYPPFDPRAFSTMQQPQLDPAVESILTNYFPQPQTAANTMGNSMVPQVPDDFLSKVFNFGWDTSGNNNNGMNNGVPMQNGQQGQPGQPGQPGMMPGFDAFGDGSGIFDGWSAHGWMA